MGWKFNPFTGKLDFVGAGGGGSPTGPAGGDLTGTYPNPTVDGLQGNPVSNAAPTNGQVLQFDGTSWVPGTIPSGGSGGGGVVYFLNNNTAADAPVTNIPQTPTTSKELSITAETTGTNFTTAILPTASYAFLASFVTDLSVPSATTIPAGVWDFNLFAESTPSGAANHVYYKIEILKYDGVNAPVLLASSPDSYIYDPQDITQYVTSVVMPQTTILATDRLVVYLYGRATQINKTITFYFGGSYPSHTHSTMPSVTGTGVVKVVNGVFQSPASTIVNADVDAAAAIAQSKIQNLTTDLSGKVNKSGDTMTGKLTLPASTTASAPINLPHGSDPTSPTNGDMWLNGTLRYRDQSGVTRFVADINRPNTFSQRQTITADSFTTDPALKITQLGSGEALRVEDDTTPDATAFVVSASGRVGIGVTPDATVALKVDSTGIKFSDNSIQTTAAVAGVTSVSATSPITSSGGATPDISTSIATNRIVGRSTAGTGVMEQLTPVGITVSAGNITGIGGTVGTVDNAVPRADGTGGYTVQPSGLIIEDAIVSFTGITGTAGAPTPDVITATGSAFVSGQPVRFTALTGGSGLNTTTNYFVVNPSGATFQVETSIGGGAVNFTTDITAGTLLTGHSVSTNVTLSENTTATNSDLVLTPKGTGALIAGPKPAGTASTGNARGSGAVDLQLSRSAATQVASGANSFVVGLDCTASGPQSAAIGYVAEATGSVSFAAGNAKANGNFSVALGQGTASASNSGVIAGSGGRALNTGSITLGGSANTANATNAACIGDDTWATGTTSFAVGQRSLSDRLRMFAHASGTFAAVGDAQRARFVLRCKTTTNAAVEMALDGSTTYLGIPSGKVIACTINISGVKSDGSAVAHYVRQYAVKNVGGTSSEVYAPVTIGTDNAAGTVIALSANNGDDTLRIAVTGIAAETWRWVASVDAVEIAYGT